MTEERESSGWLGLGRIARLLRERGKDADSEKNNEVFSGEALSVEGCFRVVIREGKKLDFYSTNSPERMFSINGSLVGPLSKFTKADSGSGKRVIVQAPVVLANGKKIFVKATYFAPRELTEGTTKLIRAGQGIIPPSTRVLEFLYSRGECEFRYVVEIDSSVEVMAFSEVLDKRPLFQTVPPVVQMSAFLRAITRKRRTVLNVLENLRGQAKPQVQACIDLLGTRCQEDCEIDEAYPIIIRDLLKEQERIISDQVIAAFALFVDMQVGNITVEQIAAATSVSASPGAIFVVARHFGLKVTPDSWQQYFSDLGESFEGVAEKAELPAYRGVIEQFQGQWDNRTPVQILRQISKESNSNRAAAFAEKLYQKLQDGRLAINDQQLALLAVLSAVGRRYHANTVVALCLFVDAEVGFVGEDAIDNLAAVDGSIETSTYAMLAVAGAFDVSLRGLVIEVGPNESLDVCFPRLVELAKVGLLGGFLKRGEHTPVWHWIRTPAAASKILKSPGAKFTRTILGAFPIIDQLSEIDLVDILASGRDFVVAFQSDLDKSLLWRRISDIIEDEFSVAEPVGERRSYSFIEGFRAYHFSRALVGSFETAADEQLIGRKNVIAVYLDNRENRHYRCIPEVRCPEDLEPLPNTGYVWSHTVIAELDVSTMPGKIRELGHDVLLGRSNKMSADYRRMGWMHEALWLVLARQPEYQSLSMRPDIIERIYNKMWTPPADAVLGGLIDEQTYKILGRVLKNSRGELDFSPYSPMLEGYGDEEQLEFVGLRVVLEMCLSDLIEFEGYFKQVDEKAFRAIIHNRLLKMAQSDIDGTRAMAMRLLATQEEVSDATAKLVVTYELQSALNDESGNVGQAASEGLVRLCLQDYVPLPDMIKLTNVASAPVEDISVPVAAEIPGLDVEKVRKFELEVDNWIKSIKNENIDNYRALPFVAPSGDIDRVRLRSFIELIVALNEACCDQSGELPRRYLAIVPNRELEIVRSAVLESWKLMAQSQKCRLSDLASATRPAEVFLDYRFFVEDNDRELRRELGAAPYLGGEDSPLQVYHFRAGEPVGPYRERDNSFVQLVRDECQFFTDLLSMYFESAEGHVRVLRVASAGGMRMDEIETFLPVFTTARAVDVRFAEVLQSHRIRFSPIVHQMAFSIEQIGSSPEDLEDFRALLALFKGQRWRKDKSASSEQRAAAAKVKAEVSESREASPAAPSKSEAGEAGESAESGESEEGQEGHAAASQPKGVEKLTELATDLRKSFGLPPELDRQVANMLMMAARRSIYEIDL